MKKKIIIGFRLLILISIMGFSLYFANSYFILYNDAKLHSCEQLPLYQDAKNIFYDNNETIKTIEGFSNEVWVELNKRCTDRGEITIYYGAFETRNKIVEYLGPAFHSIPYRLVNI